MELSDRANFDHFERQPPSVAARRLAALLAERLDAVVPRPFRVQADAGTVTLYEGAAFDSSSYLAMLGTRTDGARVFLWYGPYFDREADAVLSFAPIDLAELLAPE